MTDDWLGVGTFYSPGTEMIKTEFPASQENEGSV